MKSVKTVQCSSCLFFFFVFFFFFLHELLSVCFSFSSSWLRLVITKQVYVLSVVRDR